MSVDEFDYRELCSDGACNGLIGPSGTCKVCGRAAQGWGDERKRGMRNPTDPPPLAGSSNDALQPELPSVIGGWASRTLCSDGTCLGVIAEDGKCTVCGKAGIIVETLADDSDEDDDEYEDDDEDEDDDDDDEDDDEGDAEDAEDGIQRVDGFSGVGVITLAPNEDGEPERELCDDGACVGVIGADGRCKVCGRSKLPEKDAS